MEQSYAHLDLEDRCAIARLHQQGCSIRQIAAALDRSPSSISRELKRNSGTQLGYKPAYADQKAKAGRWTGSKLERDHELREIVLQGLARRWSPEQVAGWLRRSKPPRRISMRPFTASSTPRSAAPMTAPGGSICPDRNTSAADGPVQAGPRRNLSKTVCP